MNNIVGPKVVEVDPAELAIGELNAELNIVTDHPTLGDLSIPIHAKVSHEVEGLVESVFVAKLRGGDVIARQLFAAGSPHLGLERIIYTGDDTVSVELVIGEGRLPELQIRCVAERISVSKVASGLVKLHFNDRQKLIFVPVRVVLSP